MFLSNLPCHPKRPDVRDEGSRNGWDEGGGVVIEFHKLGGKGDARRDVDGCWSQ